MPLAIRNQFRISSLLAMLLWPWPQSAELLRRQAWRELCRRPRG
jgi:hypothetical protein